MSEMLEKVAREILPDAWEIFDQCMEGKTPEQVAKERGEWESIKISLNRARAALLALREPTEGMVEAMQVEVNLLDDPDPPNAVQFLSRDEVNSIWQAAIDHALQTQEKGK